MQPRALPYPPFAQWVLWRGKGSCNLYLTEVLINGWLYAGRNNGSQCLTSGGLNFVQGTPLASTLTPEPDDDDDDDDDDDIDLRPEGASETDCLRSPEGYRDVLS
jgi:hypothetical protein